MKPELWGSNAWKFLHAIALNYPINPSENKQKSMKSFIISLKDILPCEICCINYNTHLNELNIDNAVLNQNNLIHFFIDLHNSVNKLNKKKTYSYEEAKKEIQYLYRNPLNMMWLLIVIIICLAIGSYYIYNQYDSCRKAKQNKCECPMP